MKSGRSRDPITGKLIRKPKVLRLDMIDPKPLPPEVTVTETERVTKALADIRAEYAAIGNKRYGIDGKRLMADYRKLALEYRHLTGKQPPQIMDDM